MSHQKGQRKHQEQMKPSRQTLRRKMEEATSFPLLHRLPSGHTYYQLIKISHVFGQPNLRDNTIRNGEKTVQP